MGPGYAIAPVTRAAPTSRDRIDQLLASGKRDAAVRLFASELRSLVQQQTANPQNLRYYHQQMEQVKTRISDHGMSEEVLKSFSPGDGGNPNKLGEYALVLDLFGRAQAKEIYERILVLRPKDDMARVRMILFFASSPSNAAAIEKQWRN